MQKTLGVKPHCKGRGMYGRPSNGRSRPTNTHRIPLGAFATWRISQNTPAQRSVQDPSNDLPWPSMWGCFTYAVISFILDVIPILPILHTPTTHWCYRNRGDKALGWNPSFTSVVNYLRIEDPNCKLCGDWLQQATHRTPLYYNFETLQFGTLWWASKFQLKFYSSQIVTTIYEEVHVYRESIQSHSVSFPWVWCRAFTVVKMCMCDFPKGAICRHANECEPNRRRTKRNMDVNIEVCIVWKNNATHGICIILPNLNVIAIDDNCSLKRWVDKSYPWV